MYNKNMQLHPLYISKYFFFFKLMFVLKLSCIKIIIINNAENVYEKKINQMNVRFFLVD